jgi:hypothetical protein
LPSTSPKPEEVADEWKGHKSLFDGLTLTGFTGDGWEAKDGVLKPKAGAGPLTTAKPLPAGELLFDTNHGKAGWKRAVVQWPGGKPAEWPAGAEVRNLFFREAGK